ncbi:hypothetical protein L665_03128 [Ralstonia solanacearum SD54]|nr:hypothetical protein F504_1268 [Ralstonia pseudosolanacearum FQY_4]ANH33428.1 hypothetical protein A3768_2281 [Ralstonia solanacearum]ESS47568.1 hypothetical protein L665_03128 [Ralstonia solanacearum SD54]
MRAGGADGRLGSVLAATDIRLAGHARLRTKSRFFGNRFP